MTTCNPAADGVRRATRDVLGLSRQAASGIIVAHPAARRSVPCPPTASTRSLIPSGRAHRRERGSGGARAAARSSKTSGRTRNRPGDLPAFAMLNQIQAASENALRVTISDS